MGDVDAKARKLMVGVDEKLSKDQVKEQLITHVSGDKEYELFIFSWFDYRYISKTNQQLGSTISVFLVLDPSSGKG